MKLILSILIIIGFTSCGYKPSSKLSRGVVGDKISTSIVISADDPENTVIIKDAVDEAVIRVFHASLVDRASSQTHLAFSIKGTSYSPIVYDNDGFVVGYRMYIRMSIKRFKSGKSKNYKAYGTYDFEVKPNAIITDQERFDAIKFSSTKAIYSFLAQISAEGARTTKGY